MRKKDLYSQPKSLLLPVVFFLFFTIIISCNNGVDKPAEKAIVEEPEKMDEKVSQLIRENLDYLTKQNGRLKDTIVIYQLPALSALYNQKKYSAAWSKEKSWLPQGNSLISFLDSLKLYGLFPEDYHTSQIKNIADILEADSLGVKDKKDAALWVYADILLSDALINIIQDLKLGRLPQDSITLRKDSILTAEFVSEKFNAVATTKNFDSVISTLEPRHKGYHDLKAGIRHFLLNADFKELSQISFPDSNKSLVKTGVISRLLQLGYIDSTLLPADSSLLAKTLIKFQNEKGLTADGKIGAQTIRALNLSDIEKFKRIAITLDRYKMLADTMPPEYIWVNIPAYNLKLYRNDTIIINSRVVVGKPKTRTPVLTSSIYEIVTYPQWTIPQSIIVKEILPALKKNPGYLSKKGYGLFDNKGEEIDPFTIDWSKYKKGIPYRIIQGSGDDNALGILKFNFRNNYSVYLHDTNQRFYFGLASRALSHGCIRVQEWDKMAFYILEQELEFQKKKKTNKLSIDSVKHWLANKEKHSIPVYSRMPVFVRYFTCESINDQIIFFEDIYNEDQYLVEKLFHNKKIG